MAVYVTRRNVKGKDVISFADDSGPLFHGDLIDPLAPKVLLRAGFPPCDVADARELWVCGIRLDQDPIHLVRWDP